MQLGWEVTLHGFLAKNLIKCQHDYYSEIESRKIGTRWGVQLITKLWIIIHQHRMNRNEVLHKSEAIDKVSYVELLKEAVIYAS